MAEERHISKTGFNPEICLICHDCEEHVVVKLHDYISTVIAALDADPDNEPCGWVCGDCVEKRGQSNDPPTLDA